MKNEFGRNTWGRKGVNSQASRFDGAGSATFQKRDPATCALVSTFVRKASAGSSPSKSSRQMMRSIPMVAIPIHLAAAPVHLLDEDLIGA